MYRSIFYLGLIAAVLSGLGLIIPSSFSSLTPWLPQGILAFPSLALGIILTYFAVANFLRKQHHKVAFTLIGCGLLTLALVGLFSPTYMGLLSFYVRPAITLVILLNGLGYLLAGLEYERPSLQEQIEMSYLNFRRKFVLYRAAGGRANLHKPRSA